MHILTTYLRSFFLTLLVLTSASLHAQAFEAGILGGMSAYKGDLNTDRIYHKVYPAAGLLLRINHNDRFSTRVNIASSVLRGSDRSSDQPFRNILENPAHPTIYYEVETAIYELSLQGEFNILPFSQGDASTPFSPYLFAGVGGVFFSPDPMEFANGGSIREPTYGDHWHADDDQEYNNLTLAGLAGFGFKYNFTQHLSGGIEFGMRVTTTDYIDEVSNKGDPGKNDWYSFTGFTLTYDLGFLRRPGRVGCPY